MYPNQRRVVAEIVEVIRTGLLTMEKKRANNAGYFARCCLL
jgi:hypothetical protein